MAGSTKARGGKLIFGGEEFLPTRPKEAIRRGIAYCSDDRKHDGLFLGRPIMENFSAPALETISARGILSHAREKSSTENNAVKFTESLDWKPSFLSVGLGLGYNELIIAAHCPLGRP